MTNKELADIMYPDVTKTIQDYENMYPRRNLPEGAMVTRFAPSPTGFVHMGSLLTTFVTKKAADDTNGIFYLRIEDTDQERLVENGIEGILEDLNSFNIAIDEGPLSDTVEIGTYGPYIQTKRTEIYDTYAKWLVENDYAYPCFCKSEEMTSLREKQEANKERIGYYGEYAKCRNLSNTERINRIKDGETFVLRLKSTGDFNKKVIINDIVRGKIEYPQNDIDHILIKTNGIPVYHLAAMIDDHLMGTTHITRGEEWFPSTPIHIEIIEKFGWKLPKFCHLGLLMKEENGVRRKLSKRKDPESAVSYYAEKGIPVEAVKIYLMTIANSNFEGWFDQNKDKSIDEFKFDFKKMSVSGSLFDLEKLFNISKNYISRLKATEVFEGLDTWACKYDVEFHKLINDNKELTTNILNIEREQKKPRKDFSSYDQVKESIWYMYEELFTTKEKEYEFNTITNIEEIKNIYNTYINNYYSKKHDKNEWFEALKKCSEELGYTSDMKAYKENPGNFKGSVADISMVIRVVVTTKSTTPDLYEIMNLLSDTQLKDRINHIN